MTNQHQHPCPDCGARFVCEITRNSKRMRQYECDHFQIIGDDPKSEPYAQVEGALVYLASVCDGAQSKDGQGFNGRDAGFGADLARRIEREKRPLTIGQATAALRMLKTYTGQLQRAHILLPDAIEESHLPQPAPAPAPTPAPMTQTRPPDDHRIVALGEDRFAVMFPYNPALVDKVKTIGSGRFNGDVWPKRWEFPIAKLDRAMEVFPDFSLDAKLAAPFEAAKAKAKAAVEAETTRTAQLLAHIGPLDAPLPNGRTLYLHQQQGVFRMAHRHRVILADDMGLGKTLQALLIAKAWHETLDVPILVIAPKSLRENWLREAASVQVELEMFSWAKLPEPLERPYVMIADEAHYAQSGSKSARGRAYLELAASDNCMACYSLTGTPMKNAKPVNLIPLLQAARHPIVANKVAFEKRYCNAQATRFSKWDTSGAAHLDELHEKLKDVMIRRLKKDCLDLPEKIRDIRRAEMSAEAGKEYHRKLKQLAAEYQARKVARRAQLAEELATALDANDRDAIRNRMANMDNADAIVALGQMRHAGSDAKAEAAIEMAQDIIEQGDPVVVFTEFVDSAERIAAELRKTCPTELLTGAVTGNEDTDQGVMSKRQAMVDRFQAGQSKAFVSTIRAGGVGITLTAASYALLVDRPWTPGDAEQAEDRIHRIGQNKTANCIWLQANGVDEMIDELLIKKSERIELVLEGKRKTLRGATGSVASMAHRILNTLFDLEDEDDAQSESA